jgi:hypothetical protein
MRAPPSAGWAVVDGEPLQDMSLVVDPANKVLVVMKDIALK